MRPALDTWRLACLLGLVFILDFRPSPVLAQTPTATSAQAKQPAARPIILMNRWQEDWSSLANPAVPRVPLDNLKYIPLSSEDAQSYISLGITARERFETNDAPQFGVGNRNYGSNYLLQRLQFHVDIHPDERWRIFLQLEDARAFWKTT